MKGEAVVIIPARYQSTRLPGKPILPLAGIPMINHVVRRASKAELVSRVLVATDDERIAQAVRSSGGQAVMTNGSARSGTDRVAEAVTKALSDLDASIIVNVQGDEPLIEPVSIDAVVRILLEDPAADIATASEPIDKIDDVFNPNVVKVVTREDGTALYFSRSPIPYIRTGPGESLEDALRRDPALLINYRKHSGLYAYRRYALQELARLQSSQLEEMECLEQLRALARGFRIVVAKTDHRSIGVDTDLDYQRVQRILEEDQP